MSLCYISVSGNTHFAAVNEQRTFLAHLDKKPYLCRRNRGVEQLAAHVAHNHKVDGSSPSAATNRREAPVGFINCQKSLLFRRFFVAIVSGGFFISTSSVASVLYLPPSAGYIANSQIIKS